MTPAEIEELKNKFEKGDIVVGIEHLIPSANRKPMPTKVTMPPANKGAEKDKEK